MNMAKLGIVSTFGNDCQSSLKSNRFNVLGFTPYTLCEVDNRLCRNRNRHSFAFYRTAIIGNTPAGASCDLSRKPVEWNWLACKVAVLVPLQLILISITDPFYRTQLNSLQSLLCKACMLLRRYGILFQLVCNGNPLKTRASLAVCGFGGFGLLQLSLRHRVLPSGPAKTALSNAVRALQRKTWVRTVTEYYSKLVTVTRTPFFPQKSVAQLTPKQVLGGCHA